MFTADCMSEAQLYLLSQRLRLLARQRVSVTQDGDFLSGRLRLAFESAFQRTSSLLDLVVDGDQLRPGDMAWLSRTQKRVQQLRPAVRELEASVC
jgi:hypothetical protein